MATTDLENSGLAGTEFTPFHDTNQPRIEKATLLANVSSSGINTRVIDPYREGVNIRTSRHRFNSTQAKLWSGNLNHYTTVRTLGQARSFTEYGNSAQYTDQPVSISNSTHPAGFNPIQYLSDQSYPFPIIFNDGPQQQEEAFVEPFTIYFRKPNIEGVVKARSVKATLEDGNDFDSEKKASNRITQFIPFTSPTSPRFFLDEGQDYFGESAQSGSVVLEGFTPIIQRNIIPYNETKNERIVDRIQTTDADLISALKSLKFDLDGDLRESFDKKSASAGYDVYGPGAGWVGTDSIAYIGTARGS